MPATNLLDSNSCRSTAYAKDLRGSLRLFSLSSSVAYIHSTIDRGFRSPLDSCCDIRSSLPPLLRALIRSFFSSLPPNHFDPSLSLSFYFFFFLLLLYYPLPLTASRTKHFLIGFRSERTVRFRFARDPACCFCRFYRVSTWLLSSPPRSACLSFERLFISSFEFLIFPSCYPLL